MKKLVNIIWYFSLSCLVFSIGFFGAMLIDEVYRQSEDIVMQEKQIDYLKQENVALAQMVNHSKKAVYSLMGDVTVLKHQQKVMQEKPSYETLKSHTVYMVQERRLNSIVLGKATGTGVIVKQKGNISYILTNKHICNEETQGSCFVEVLKYGVFVKIPLTFVKQAKNDYDLALWKTDEKLPGKTPIKGLREAYPQDKVYSVGNYLGFRSIYTEGTFAGYEEEYAVVNMPCVYGCSGSAVFDKDAYLIGLAFAVNRISPCQVDTTKTIMVPYEIVILFLERLL